LNEAILNQTSKQELVNLYERAFRDFGTRALWNMQPVREPGPADALAITRALRTHAGIDGRRLAEKLAEKIEELCRAAH
jgi:hypothetical protein